MSNRRRDLEQDIARVSGRGAVTWLCECGSTMDVAREQGEVAALGLVAADCQTAGRGRQGREWQSVPGAFQGTFIFPLSTESNPAATLVVGIAVCEALAKFGVDIKLKWPNDLISNGGRKIGGILTEYVAHPKEYLIGIGVNLIGANIEIAGARIGSVHAEYGQTLSALEFAIMLWPILEKHLCRVQESGFANYRESWTNRAAFLGAEISVDVGSEPVVGQFIGVDDRGAMLLRVAGVTRAISTGHVTSISQRQNG